MGCGKALLKGILVALNVIFFLAGAAVLGVGLWLRFDKQLDNLAAANGLKEFIEPMRAASYILIAFGALTFIIGFCGCCGALKESKCLLGLYIAFVVAILAAEIGGGVFVYVKRNDIFAAVKTEGLKYLQETYGSNSSADLAWDTAMKEFSCCGIANGSIDFKKSKLAKASFPLPKVCCKMEGDGYKDLTKCKNDAFDTSKPTSEYVNKEGCLAKIEELVKKYSTILIGVGVGVAGFELLVVLMAICFCCGIEKD